MAAIRSDLKPAFLGSLALHVGVVATALIAWKLAPPPAVPKPIVPVTILSGTSAPEAAPRRAETPTPARAPEPEPKPAPLPPAEMDTPSPPAPPRPPPRPAPAKAARAEPAPAPAKPAPLPKPQPRPADLNLDALASSLARSAPARRPARELDLGAIASSLPRAKPAKVARNDLDLGALTASLPAGSRHAAAQRGAARTAAAPTVRPAAPPNLTGDELGALRDKWSRLWRPNCEAEGASRIVIRVALRLSASGYLVGSPEVVGQSGEGVNEAVIDAAAQRAKAAVRAGEPYTEIPREKLAALPPITARFNGKEACSAR